MLKLNMSYSSIMTIMEFVYSFSNPHSSTTRCYFTLLNILLSFWNCIKTYTFVSFAILYVCAIFILTLSSNYIKSVIDSHIDCTLVEFLINLILESIIIDVSKNHTNKIQHFHWEIPNGQQGEQENIMNTYGGPKKTLNSSRYLYSYDSFCCRLIHRSFSLLLYIQGVSCN